MMIDEVETQLSSLGEYNTGLKLFDKFQNQWEQLHIKSEDIVIKAKTAVAKLVQLENRSSRQLEAIELISVSYKSLAKLDEQIESIQRDLQSLETCFTKIGDSISILRRQKEEEEKAIRLRSLELQEQLRQGSYEIISSDPEEERKLEERRQILAKAFQEDISRYLRENQP